MEIALLGTGLMGRPMAERLLEANHRLIVFNRTREKAEPLRTLGAEIAESAHEAIRSSKCVILMLANAQAIHEVLLSPPSLAELSHRTVIQMGTISPTESIAISREVLKAGGDYLEAPVLGSIAEAKGGKLILMVGAPPEQFRRWLELLKCLGPDPLLIGPVGHASGLKLAMNQLIASLTAAFALSLGFVQRKEIDVDLFMRILRDSFLYAPQFDKKFERMISRDHSNPYFPTKHLVKDIDLFLSEAKSMNIDTLGLEGIRRLLAITLERGYTEEDYSAMFDAITQKGE
ncbi:MAG: NAD(P)-dependent oxidoreductase [Thermodesulfobacteriota bacterium]